jgi:ankyrin repeat protein
MSLSNKPRIDNTQSTLLLPDISPLIWIQGTGPGSRGSVLVNLAQNGYTQEAHQIISLSRIASLIGRDSNGGLPELWDVMGKVRGKGGITRLMAICATRGSLSSQRALSLIRDHNVDVRATDNQGRTALHYALRAGTFSDPLSMNPPINTDLIRVLIEACPDLVKMKDYNTRHPLYDACISNAPFDVIKLFIDIYPEGFKDISLNKLSSSTLVALAKEKAVKENSSAASNVAHAPASNVAHALGSIAQSETGRQSCIAAGAPLALTELAKEKTVKENSSSARLVSYALGNISTCETGRQSCIDAGAPLALTELAKEKTVKENCNAAEHVAYALGNIAFSDAGRQCCIASGATLALTELAKEKAVKENSDASKWVAHALGSIAESETGRQSCIAAGAPLVLTELAKEKAVKEDSFAARYVTMALLNITKSETGIQSCIDSGAPLALTELAKEKAVKEDSFAARYVARALLNITKSETGRQSCIDSGAPLALTELAKEKAVKENSVTAGNVARALRNFCKSETGRQSCIASGMPHSSIDWASMKSSRENDLIWIHGTRPGSRGSVLDNLAQNGYTQEAHQIISLSRTASLIGRDSDGGLPEVWDITGEVRGEGGITRLMAICATRGSLSSQRALSLIRDHNVDVRATDNQGRTALHYALRAGTFSDPLSMNPPINTDLIRVLIEACPDLVKMKDYNTRHPLYDACISNAPFDVIKLFIDIYPEGFKDVSLNKLSLSTLVALAKEKAVKENGVTAWWVANALGKISLSDTGRQCCIAAGAPLALTELAKEKAVKENSDAAKWVAHALGSIAESETGRQSCIDAGAPLVLVTLSGEKAVKEKGDAARRVAFALNYISESESGRQSCIDAGAPLALTNLAKEKAVKENAHAAEHVARALCNIALSDAGRQSCIDAGAPLALTNLAKEKAVKLNRSALGNVAGALRNFCKSDAGRQSCIASGMLLECHILQ